MPDCHECASQTVDPGPRKREGKATRRCLHIRFIYTTLPPHRQINPHSPPGQYNLYQDRGASALISQAAAPPPSASMYTLSLTAAHAA